MFRLCLEFALAFNYFRDICILTSVEKSIYKEVTLFSYNTKWNTKIYFLNICLNTTENYNYSYKINNNIFIINNILKVLSSLTQEPIMNVLKLMLRNDEVLKSKETFSNDGIELCIHALSLICELSTRDRNWHVLYVNFVNQK